MISKTGYNGKSQCMKYAVGNGLLCNPINVSNDKVIIINKRQKQRGTKKTEK